VAAAGCQPFGVNLNGGDFGQGQLPGTYGTDYVYPGINFGAWNEEGELDYFHARGLNLVRYPFLWERLQHALNGPLTDFDLARLDQAVSNAAARGMALILEPHNYGRRSVGGAASVIGSGAVPYGAFTDFWQKLAAHFAGRPGLYAYSLINEPHDMGGLWVGGGAQAGINGIRQADARTPILVPGDGWSAAWQWVPDGNDALKSLIDPAGSLIFEAHQYFDSDNTGAYAQGYDAQGAYPNLGVDRVQPFVDWLRANGLRGIVTEYGVPNNDGRWLPLLDNFLAYLRQSSDVLVGGTAWAAGPWWYGYPLSVEAAGGQDRPQMSVLARYASPCPPVAPRGTLPPAAATPPAGTSLPPATAAQTGAVPNSLALTGALYTAVQQQLTVQVSDPNWNSVLTVSVAGTGPILGTMTYRGGGQWVATFSVASYPPNIVVRSNSGAAVTHGVSVR